MPVAVQKASIRPGIIGNVQRGIDAVQQITGTDAASRRLNMMEQEKEKQAFLDDPNSPILQSVRQEAQRVGINIPDGATLREVQDSPLGDFINRAQQGRIAQRLSQAKKVAGGSEFEKQVQKNAAKDFVEFQKKAPSIAADIGKLDEVVKKLSPESGITGTAGEKFFGFVPDLIADPVRSVTSPELSQVKSDIESVVQKSLRETLGAQFTENEGERLIKRAFNPALSPQENRRRVLILKNAMQSALDSRMALSRHFMSGGTLANFKGVSPEKVKAGIRNQIAQFESADGEQGQQGPQGVIPTANAAQNKGFSADDLQAANWARANSNDPKARQIAELLKAKGINVGL